MRHPGLLAALMLAGMAPGGLPIPGPRRAPEPPDDGPLDVPCPKCGAAAGEPCARDNRRHRFHLARVRPAAKE